MNKQDLNDFVAHNLYELAWRKNCPVNPGVGLWSFSAAMKAVKISHDISTDPVEFHFTHILGDEAVELATTLPRAKILEGWGWNPPASPRAIYDSIYGVYDRMHDRFDSRDRDKQARRSHVWEDRNLICRSAREVMEKVLATYFDKYHENALEDVREQKSSGPKPPQILNQVLETDFDIELIQQCHIWQSERESSMGPVAEYLEMNGWREHYDENYFPSVSTCLDYLWALVLERLIKSKGYPLQHKFQSRDELIERLCISGWDTIKDQYTKKGVI